MKRQFQAFNYKVVNQSEDTLDVYIDGTIVDAETQEILQKWFGDETSVSYKSFRDQVTKANPKTLNVYVNSGGGIVTDAMAMHDFIQEQKKNGVTVNTIGRGIIASAATYILMAGGDNATMSENSWFMIHNVSGFIWGDVNIVENYAKSMRKFNDAVTGFYAKATGLGEKEIGKMMDAETWMTASEAKEKGFVKNIESKADFNNTISPDHWPYSNTSVLNAYNSAVKIPSAKSEGDHKSFLTSIQNGFMKLIDSLNDAIKNGKTDKKFENIENRDAILEMVNSVLAPVVNKIDDAIAGVVNEGSEATEEKPAETTTTETKPAETEKKEEDKPEEKKEGETATEAAPAENKALKDLQGRLDKLENENKKLRDSLAAKNTKPESEGSKNSSTLSKVTVEYED